MARIVYCDDDESILKVVQTALRSTPHEVFVARDGIEGLALIAEVLPDLVFTDAAMPGMGGAGLKEALSAQPDLAHIPVVLVTGADLEAGKYATLAAGGWAGYLSKPFRVKELREAIAMYV